MLPPRLASAGRGGVVRWARWPDLSARPGERQLHGLGARPALWGRIGCAGPALLGRQVDQLTQVPAAHRPFQVPATTACRAPSADMAVLWMGIAMSYHNPADEDEG